MAPGLRRAATLLLAGLGLPRRLHRALRRDRLAILAYHGLVREPLAPADWCFLEEREFRRQMDYLAGGFEVVPLAEGVRRLARGEIDRPLAVITFDDGFLSVHDLALPILERLRLPATVFLSTGLVGGDDTVWFCRLHRALAGTDRRFVDWRGRRFDLAGPAARAAASARLQAELKALPQPLLMQELRALVRELGDDPARPVEPGSPYRMVGAAELRALLASSLVELGAHTVSHAILSRLGPEDQAREIEDSLAWVAALTGRPCRLFAYTNGRRQDYDQRALRVLAARGVTAAVTSVTGPNDRATPPLELRRYGIGSGEGMARFQLAVHHVGSLLPGGRH